MEEPGARVRSEDDSHCLGTGRQFYTGVMLIPTDNQLLRVTHDILKLCVLCVANISYMLRTYGW